MTSLSIKAEFLRETKLLAVVYGLAVAAGIGSAFVSTYTNFKIIRVEPLRSEAPLNQDRPAVPQPISAPVPDFVPDDGAVPVSDNAGPSQTDPTDLARLWARSYRSTTPPTLGTYEGRWWMTAVTPGFLGENPWSRNLTFTMSSYNSAVASRIIFNLPCAGDSAEICYSSALPSLWAVEAYGNFPAVGSIAFAKMTKWQRGEYLWCNYPWQEFSSFASAGNLKLALELSQDCLVYSRQDSGWAKFVVKGPRTDALTSSWLFEKR